MIAISQEKLKSASIKHFKYFGEKVLKKLNGCIKNQESIGEEKDFYEFLKDKYKDILIGKPESLASLIENIKREFPAINLKIANSDNDLCNKISGVFNYDNFVSNYNGWGAYAYAKELGIDVCPYCNRQYIVTYSSSDGRCRCELDHFFNKAKYPYLALSMYNLIPSCKTCNSSFKGDKSFSLKTHVHPFVEGFGDEYIFTINFKDSNGKDNLDFIQNPAVFDIKFKSKTGIDSILTEKAKCNVKIFKLEELYCFHKETIIELMEKNIIYSESMINDLYNQYAGTLFQSRDEVLRLIIGNYCTDKDLGKRPLAKCMKDIADELGLLKR